VNAVMISCRGRRDERELTLGYFHQAGIGVKVFESPCDPPSTGGIMTIALEAMRWAARQEGDVLFLEDDLLLDTDLLRVALLEATECDSITYLYLNDTPSRMRTHYGTRLAGLITAGAPIAPGVRSVADPRALFGTQCVFIPARFVAPLVDYCEGVQNGRLAFDTALLRFIQSGAASAAVFLPHPVQHRVVKKLYHGGPVSGDQLSASFGLPLAR
jgi:hypothetical protein